MADTDPAHKVATYLRTKYTLPLEAPDEKIIAYARKQDPEGLSEITKKAYASMGGARPEEDSQPIEPTAMERIGQQADQFNQAIEERASQGEPASMALNFPGAFGRASVRGLEKVQEMAGPGIVSDAASGLQVGAEMLPQTATQTLMLGIPFEKATNLVGKSGAFLVNKGGQAFEKVAGSSVGKATGMNLFREAWLSGISSVKNKAVALERLLKANDLAETLSKKLDFQVKMLSYGLPDSVEYGVAAKGKIKASTELAKSAIVPESNAIEEMTKGYAKESLEGIAGNVKQIEDDLLGVLETSKDSPVKKIVGKYTGNDVLPEVRGKIFDYKTGLFREKTKEEAMVRVYPEADVADLLKDRGRVGKLYVASLESGSRDTAQSKALLSFQEIIDQEIERRTKDSPELLARIQKNRANWRSHYQEFWNPQVNDIRSAKYASEVGDKILATPEGIDIGKKLLPELMPELVRKEKVRIIDSVSKSSKPTLALEDEIFHNKDKYSRLFSQDDIKELHQITTLGRHAEKAHKIADTMAKEITEAVPQRRASELVGKMRTGDPATTAQMVKSMAPGALYSGGVAFATLSHAISPTTTVVLSGLGVTPAAFSAAYYAGDRKMRGMLIGALKGLADNGAKASASDIAILRSVGYVTAKKDMGALFNRETLK